MTPAELRRVVLLVALLVLAVGAVVAAAWMHERRMGEVVNEAFFDNEAASRDVGIERFFASTTPGAANPAAAVQARKASAYLGAGLGFFFSANTDVDVAAATENYYVFFPPTASDLTCDFTNIQGSPPCKALVDEHSCTDRTTNIPANYISDTTLINNTAGEPVAATDCRVSIFDSVYQMTKTAVRARAFIHVPAGQPTADGRPVLLTLPRSAFSTRLIMMLRPTFVRSGLSRLYYVDYGAAGTDGAAYDSWDASAGVNAVLQLVPVMDPSIDSNTTPIASVVNQADANPFSPPSAVRPGTGTGAGTGAHPTSATTPAAVARGLVIPRTTARVDIVCYYLNYVSANPSVPQGANTPVATAIMRVLPNATTQVVDATGGNVVLSLSCGGAITPTLTIATSNGGNVFTMPALDAGVATVTYSHDVIIASCSTPQRTSVRRFALPQNATLSYRVAPGATPCGSDSPDVAQIIGRYASTVAANCIPNMADVALRASCLSPSPLSVTEVARLDTDTLTPEVPLAPGQYLVSASGAFKAVFQWDCNFVVYNTKTKMPVWASNTSMNGSTRPGALTLGRRDGVLRAFASTQPRQAPYWSSAANAAPADQAPYTAQLTNGGVIVVKGALGAGPVWASTPGNNGVASLATCGAASAMYASVNAAELSQAQYMGWTPWQHYSQVGQLEDLAWPGPRGPC